MSSIAIVGTGSLVFAGLVLGAIVLFGGGDLCRCGHLPDQHEPGERCTGTTGSRDRNDGGDWVGYWDPTPCDCSRYRRR